MIAATRFIETGEVPFRIISQPIEKKFNPLEPRDPHGRWTLVGSDRTGNVYDDEDSGVTHPVYGAGRISDIHLNRNGSHTAIVEFSDPDVGVKSFPYRNPTVEEKLNGWTLGFSRQTEEDVKPSATFDRSATAAMKRLRDAFPEGMQKTHPVISPKPFDVQHTSDPYSHKAQLIHAYISPSSEINKDLRKYGFDNLPPGIDDEVMELDQMMAAHKLKEPVTLYRGLAASEDQLSKMKPGSTITDHAYMSTAADPRWAQRFAVLRTFGEVPSAFLPTVTPHGGKPVIEKINVPAGSHMIMGEADLGPEYVLPRDTTLKVTDVSPDGSLITMDLVAPTPPAEHMSYDEMTQAVDQYLTSKKSQKRITPAQVERLAGTFDELDFSPAPVEKKYNPAELRDPHGRWERSGEALWKSGEGELHDIKPEESAAAQRIWYRDEFALTNDYLRKGIKPSQNSYHGYATEEDNKYVKDIATLKGMMDRAPRFNKPAVLVRGVNSGYHEFGKVGSKVGKVFADKGFMSATTSENESDDYGGDSGALIHLHIPAGGKAFRSEPDFFIQGYGDYDMQHEYTIAPGTRWRVDSDQMKQGPYGERREVDVTQLDAGEPGPEPQIHEDKNPYESEYPYDSYADEQLGLTDNLNDAFGRNSLDLFTRSSGEIYDPEGQYVATVSYDENDNNIVLEDEKNHTILVSLKTPDEVARFLKNERS